MQKSRGRSWHVETEALSSPDADAHRVHDAMAVGDARSRVFPPFVPVGCSSSDVVVAEGADV